MSKLAGKYIADGAITEDKLGTGAVTVDKIGSDSVNAEKLDETDNYTWTGTHDFTGGSVQVPSPSGDNDAATRSYVDNVAIGLKWKTPVKVRAQGNIDLSAPGATIDGETMVVDDRVLCDQQATGTEDGIYLWKGAAVAMVRADDAAAGSHFAGAAMVVEKRTDADKAFLCTNDTGSDVLGTDAITMIVFSGVAEQHAMGGGSHTVDTLANLNTKLSGGDELVSRTKANTWAQKQTFASGAATDAPVGLTPMASDPSSLSNGDVWPTTAGAMKSRLNGVTKRLDEELKPEMHKVTAGEVTAGYFTLAQTPIAADRVRASIVNGIEQVNKQLVGATGVTPDFDVLSGNQLHINNNGGATGLSGDIVVDDVLIVRYEK